MKRYKTIILLTIILSLLTPQTLFANAVYDELRVIGETNTSISGVQSAPSILKDGTYCFVKGQKWYAPDARPADPQLLKADKNGCIQAKRTGRCALSLKNRTVNATVINPPRITRNITLRVGEHINISPEGVPAELKISWATENMDVAQVYNGTVYATGKGNTRIHASIAGKDYITGVKTEDSPSATYLVDVPVNRPVKIPVPGSSRSVWSVSKDGIVVNKGKVTVVAEGAYELKSNDGHTARVYGNSFTLSSNSPLIATGKDKYAITLTTGQVADLGISSHELTYWKSSDPSIISASHEGLVFAGRPGKAKLQGKFHGKKIKITAKVTKGTPVSYNKPFSKMVVDDINGNPAIYVINTPKTVSDDNPLPTPEDIAYYTVSFNLNGGEGYAPDQTVSAGSRVQKPATPSKNKCDFIGWHLGNKKYNFYTPVMQDMELVARWEPSKYRILLEPMGGTCDPYEKEIPWGDPYGELPEPQKFGYSFAGWFTADGVRVSKLDTPSSNATLYAHWDEDNSVEYNRSGYILEIQQMTVDGKSYQTVSHQRVYARPAKTVFPIAPQIEGFITPEVMPITIYENKFTSITLQYDRKKYRVRTGIKEGSEQYILSTEGDGEYYYGSNVTVSASIAPLLGVPAPTIDPEDPGHRYYTESVVFDGWSDGAKLERYTFVMGAKDTTLIASAHYSNELRHQYKLSITKDTGVESVSPEEGDHWFDKGTTVNVSATYDIGYCEVSGTGAYVMDRARNVRVVAAQGLLIAWDGAISHIGSFSTTTAGGKCILIPNTEEGSSGNILVNPYIKNELLIPPGTPITVQMMAGDSNAASVLETGNIMAKATNQLLETTFIPTKSGKIRVLEDTENRGSYCWRLDISQILP